MARTVGYSEYTEEKQRLLGEICTQIFRVQKQILDSGKGVHPEVVLIDLNAGPGVVNGQDGSPLIMIETAIRRGLPFHLWACEAYASRLEALRLAIYNRVQQVWVTSVINTGTHDVVCTTGCPGCSLVIAMRWVDQHVTFVVGDHNVTIDEILSQIMRRVRGRDTVYGLAYADGNGQTDYPIGPLIKLAQHARLGKFDLVVNVNAATLKRTRIYGRDAAAAGAPNAFSKYRDTYLMANGIDQIPKGFKHVYGPRGAQQWTMFVCTNYSRLPVPRGFAAIDSMRGRAIVERLELAPREVDTGQLVLPFPPDICLAPTETTSDILPTDSFGVASSDAQADGVSDARNAG